MFRLFCLRWHRYIAGVLMLCMCLFSSPVSTMAAEPLKIDWVFASSPEFNPYWERVLAGAEQTAARLRSQGQAIEIRYYPPFMHDYFHHAQRARLHHIQTLAPDGVILVPAGQSMIETVEVMTNAGIAMVVIDRPILTTKLVTQVYFDNYRAMQMQTRWVLDQFEGVANVLILTGSEEDYSAHERLEGTLNVLSKQHVNIVGMASGNWQRTKAWALTHQWLTDAPHINLVLASNDEMALGVIQALKELERTDVKVTGFDGNADAVDAIAAGDLWVSVDQQPELMAQQALEAMVAHLTGRKVIKKVSLIEDIQLIHAGNINADHPRDMP